MTAIILEQGTDPNSAFLELDRGLKSQKLGEQCEAITRFPALFEKYPFPILINSALLKLADVFKQEMPGNNFVRVCVVDVIEATGKHLEKLINVDEFIKRITSVMHSNDPMARSLSLKILSSMSQVIGENKQVHHLIRNALESNDSVEVNAAIYASERYAAKSKTFAMSMCEKLTCIIGGLETPMEVKLQLIKIFQHMHHDPDTAATVRNLCLKLLEENPTQRVSITTLHTLTKLASHSLVDIPQQVDLLLNKLLTEVRLRVRKAIVYELDYLAQKAPLKWAENNVKRLITFTRESLLGNVSSDCLNVLTTLVAAPAFTLSSSIETALIELCRESVVEVDVKIACCGVQLFTNLALYKAEDQNNSDLCEEALDAAVCLIQYIMTDTVVISQLKMCLMCSVELAKCIPKRCKVLLMTLFDVLSFDTLSDNIFILVLDGLASLGGSQPGILAPKVNLLLEHITALSSQGLLVSTKSIKMKSLIILVFQTFHCAEWTLNAQNVILSGANVVSAWEAYRIARQASRYGHHKLAHILYKTLSSKTCSDQQHFWLNALVEVSLGEASAISEGDRADNLSSANFYLQRGLASIKAASSPSQPLEFIQKYLALRAETVICHAQLLHACLSLRTAPPPAIAAPLVSSTSREDMSRCGRVVQQLAKSVTDFINLNARYGSLYQSAFDADPQTLCHLSLLKEAAALMARSIESIIRPNTELTDINLSMVERLPAKTIEISSLVRALEEASELSRNLLQVCQEVKPVREQHLHLLQGISQILTTIPLSYPRFIFQQLQQTSITPNISPQPKTTSDSISVQTSESLAIKVEGVVNVKRKFIFRSIKNVTLVLTSHLQNRSHVMDMKGDTNETIVQTVCPHNDFFTTQFLLVFPVAGMYQVTVETSITDTEGDSWKKGPSVSLAVKAQDVSRPQINSYPSSQVNSQAFPNIRPQNVENFSNSHSVPNYPGPRPL